jgi:hypothetical protein
MGYLYVMLTRDCLSDHEAERTAVAFWLIAIKPALIGVAGPQSALHHRLEVTDGRTDMTFPRLVAWWHFVT